MRPAFALLTLWLVSACAVLQSDPWDWLFDTEQQIWEEVVLHGYGREVGFRIPDRAKRGGEHVRTWPGGREVTVPLDYDPFVPAFQAVWDQYWGGFYKPGDEDFVLSVRFVAVDDDAFLLDLPISALVDRHRKAWTDSVLGTDERRNEYLRPRFWVRAYKSPYHYWINESMPQVTADFEEYSMPYSDQMELQFRFFVRERRWGREDDPEWRESRWAIARQIIDTVQVIPPP